MSEEKVQNLLSELVDMIDNGSQRDLDRVDEISKSILKVIEKELCEDCISRQTAIELVRDVCDAIMSGCESWYDPETEDEVYKDIREVDAILKCNKEIRIALRNMPSAHPEQSFEIRDILDYLDTVLHPIISPEHWNVYSELHDMISGLPSAQFEPNCKGCKHQPRFSHEEPCCTCANNYENKYKR